MNKEELYKTRINKLITEEFGISTELHNSIIPRFIRILKKQINQSTNVKNTLPPTKEGTFHFDFFNDGKHNISVFWKTVLFTNNDEYVKYAKTHNFNACVIFKNKWFVVTIPFINNQVADNTIYGTIAHEMEHLFQNLLMGKSFGNQDIYNIARSHIADKDPFKKYLAWIVYASEKSEQEAFINDCYATFQVKPINVFNIDNFVSESECGLWLKNLYDAYHFIRNNRNNELLTKAIKEYKNLNERYNYKYFLYVARNGIKSLERRIARLTIKLKTPLLTEHTILNNNISNIIDYFLID